jgi:hypothetical protein
MHKVFDLLKCDEWETIIEKNGFAKEKNLLMRECYITLDQLPSIESGYMRHKMQRIEKLLNEHIGIEYSETGAALPLNENGCKQCAIPRRRCEVCNDVNSQFFEIQITVGGKCKKCGIWAHRTCLEKNHYCVPITAKTTMNMARHSQF